jgi:23S rRNA pseudouridine2604 synthase
MSGPVRLSKRLIEQLGCSRREAELYIEGGWVTVDGLVVDQPQFMLQAQQVALLPGARPEPVEPVTLLLNLPPALDASQALQLVNPESHCTADASAPRILKRHFLRQQTCLPLQEGASGLLLFSQDWRVLRKLTDDASRLEQEYIIEVIGHMPDNGLQLLSQSRMVDGVGLPGVKASWQSETRLRMVLKNPQPVQLVRLCNSVGLKVVGMKRIRIGAVSMGKLPPGQWRYLAPGERF